MNNQKLWLLLDSVLKKMKYECVHHIYILKDDAIEGVISFIDILKFFSKLHKTGNTIIMVTHEESVAKLSKRRIDIFDGKIARDE